METNSFERAVRPLSSARRDSIVLIRCSSSAYNHISRFMDKGVVWTVADIVRIVRNCRWGRGWRVRIAYGRRVCFIDTSKTVAATMEAYGSLP